MSWKPEIQTNGGEWSTNSLRFATEAEAFASAKALFQRWLLCIDFRATECEDTVNYQHINGIDRRITG